ncbi:MAG: murein biosynthesis integral membrane protein MurJ [Candidatus Berkelbacteria bacterium]
MWQKISKLFAEKKSLRGASILLVVTVTLSNILGLFRDRFLAKNISTYDLDIYYSAFRIPDLIFNLMILGAIYTAFVPIFTDFIAQKKEKDGLRVANSLLNLSLIFTIISAVLLYFLMPYAMKLVVPNFGPDRFDQAVRYARLMMLTPLFFSFSYILSGILNSFHRFFAYSVAPLVYNLAIMFGAYFLAPHYGVIGVIYSVIAGAFLHFLVQVFPAVKLGWRYQAIIQIKDQAVQKIIKLVIPRTISLGGDQIGLIIFTAIGSSLAAGSISAYTLASNIQTMPVFVLGSAFAAAVFPTLALKISHNDKDSFVYYFDRALRASLFLLVPVSGIFIVLRAQIVRLILGSGKFDWNDTKTTSMVLGVFAVSIVAQGLIPLVSRAFYAMKNTRIPMYISISTVAISAAIAYPLASRFGAPGLAMAYSAASFFQLIMLLSFLGREMPKIVNAELIWSFVRIILISVATTVIMWLSLHPLAGLVDMNTFLGVLEQTIGTILIGAIAFFAITTLCKCPELKWALTRNVDGEGR